MNFVRGKVRGELRGEVQGNFKRKFGETSMGSSAELSKKSSGTSRVLWGKFEGKFREISREVRGNFQEKFKGTSRGSLRELLGEVEMHYASRELQEELKGMFEGNLKGSSDALCREDQGNFEAKLRATLFRGTSRGSSGELQGEEELRREV